MTSKSKGDAGEYEFTRAASDEQRDAEKRYNVLFATFLDQDVSRGVWRLTVECYKPVEGGVDARICGYSGLWPNSTVVSFAAFLYGATHRCVRMVEQYFASGDARG